MQTFIEHPDLSVLHDKGTIEGSYYNDSPSSAVITSDAQVLNTPKLPQILKNNT